jgi:hypothetical protein
LKKQTTDSKFFSRRKAMEAAKEHRHRSYLLSGGASGRHLKAR